MNGYQYFNRPYERTGTLWEGRYRAALIDSERYLLACMRYIELNPVRAGLVRHPRDYPWSSYRADAYGESSPMLQDHEVYRRLSRNAAARQAVYRQLFRAQIPQADLEAIRQGTNKAWALGDDGFREKMAVLTGRPGGASAQGATEAVG